MITGMRLQNFKSWKDTSQIRMAPLTGFFGTNSSGKTALLQYLLVMKQTVESNDRSRVLHTGDDKTYVDVGTFSDIVHKKQVPGKINFSIKWNLDEPYNPLPIRNFNVLDFSWTEELEFSSSIIGTGKEIYLDEFEYRFTMFNKEYAFGVRRKSGKSSKNGNLAYELFSENYDIASLINSELDEVYSSGDEIVTVIENSSSLPIKSYQFSDYSRSLTSGLLSKLILEYEALFQKIYYLGPLREYPHRTYLWSGERPQNVDVRGELAIPALLAKPDVTECVAKWLKELNLVHDFKLKPIAKGRKEHEALVQVTPGSTPVPLTDVGFGVSQVLPVLTLCYYVPEGSTVIFEQPEIHLHPSIQAGLADVFIDVIKNRKLQIIVESHSEHFLHRLQRRIAESQLLPEEKQKITNEQTALYFCQLNNQGESEIEGLKMDKYGNISNWPQDFFGDELGDLVAMTEAGIKAQQQETQAAL